MSSDFLFAHPSFLTGVGRVLDIMGLFDEYNESPTPVEADLRALRSDWVITGQDLAQAMSSFDATTSEHSEPRQPSLPGLEPELVETR